MDDGKQVGDQQKCLLKRIGLNWSIASDLLNSASPTMHKNTFLLLLLFLLLILLLLCSITK